MRIKDNFRRLKQLTYILIFIIYKGMGKFYGFTNWYFILNFSSYYFTLFTYKAPNGMRAMGALANAAIATFLVEAFNKYVGGSIRNQISRGVRDAAGGLGGVAAAGLTALAIGVSPVYALVIGAACGGMDLLPGFFAGYLIGYVMKYTEKYVQMALI